MSLDKTSGRGHLRRRLLASISISVVFVLVSGLFAMLQTRAILDEFETEGEVYDAHERTVMNMRVDFQQQTEQWKELLLHAADPVRREQHWAAFERLEKKVREQSAVLLNQSQSSAGSGSLQRFIASHQRLSAQYRTGLAALRQGELELGKLELTTEDADREPEQELGTAAREISAAAERFARATQERAIATAAGNFALMLVALTVGVLALGRALRREVLKPLSALAAFAERLASGHYGERIDGAGTEEMGAVADALCHASAEIAKLISELRSSREEYRTLVEGMDAVVWVWDPVAADFLFVSDSAEAVLGRPPAEWTGGGFRAHIFHPQDLGAAIEAMERIAAEGEGEFEHRALHADGTVLCVQNRVRVLGEGIHAGKLLGIMLDVTPLKHAEARTEFFATHDRLTRLPNRVLLLDRLGQAIQGARRGGGIVGLLVVDVDRFRVVNESLGHALGDEVIRQVAARLEQGLLPEDTLAALGGAEFALVVRSREHSEQLAERAEQIRQTILAPFTLADQLLALTCTVGIAVFPRDGADPATLLTNAGTALSRAKEDGQEQFRFYAEEMNAEALARLRLESDLRRAVESDELVLFYQPQVDIHTFRMIGVEALIRWRHPERGLLGPGDFIPVAEECGLVVAIGDFVLREACRQGQAWQREGRPPISIAVNLSARQFLQPDLVQRVAAALAGAGLAPEWLELEITEGIAMHDADFVVRALNELKALGVRLAIDDFGTGYSSLSYLKRFPLDKLKIDRSFVTDISPDGDEAIVSAIIAMARSLDLKVIAEGVETEFQLTYLQAYQCDEAQGWYFGRPVPADQVEWAADAERLKSL